ncbi:RNA polymerase II subunit A C-terminal domain phosphatase [Tupaia chinensis]|uniref:RNA polymerase II subunit A C-terminal domain phosphatase n=1 Tax=Tupaia chinensis TaxID=246437 RepID=L8Y685_TUPCH|nr:RNA polymerase II subunit A C-terminal domain phosphatase [Tupaia chinensis]
MECSTVNVDQAEELGREDQQRLHRNRKLVLMVDLDQTLIHTTEQHCAQMSNRGIFHFQLGRGEPMLHTRLRPHCKDFLEKVAKLYELHVFTFGSRLYAHTIAGFLDPEKKLFSHRILSRDECIDPFSKTGNLRNLFPCGDSMVCIIDDREDVWKFAPNLITVKKYVYFQGTGDLNAPPGSREGPPRRKGADVSEQTLPAKGPEGAKRGPGAELGSSLGKPVRDTRELNGGEVGPVASPQWDLGHPSKAEERDAWPPVQAPSQEPAGASVPSGPCEQGAQTAPGRRPTQGPDLDFDLSSDSECSEKSSTSDRDGEEQRARRQLGPAADGAPSLPQGGPPDAAAGGIPAPEVGTEPDGREEGERDSPCGLGNGYADRKEAETESQNSEQSGVTAGESLDQSVEEEEEDVDEDDHLVHLEEILVRVHSHYYARYDSYLRGELGEAPDIRRIVPELRSKVLADVAILFSGLHPTNFPVEKTREHYHATALGAKILTQLVLSPDAPDRATHLIAARAGTEKVRQAQESGHVHVVSPGWLWSCLERWDKVEEQLFPLRDDSSKVHRWVLGLLAKWASICCRGSDMSAHLGSAWSTSRKLVRVYDSSTGKLIRPAAQGPGPTPPSTLPDHREASSFRAVQPHQQQTFGEEPADTPSGEQPGPTRRRRQPSLSETMPLYTLCKEDLESMDKEVDDILGEGSDDSDTEKKPPEEQEREGGPPPGEPEARGAPGERAQASSSSGERMSWNPEHSWDGIMGTRVSPSRAAGRPVHTRGGLWRQAVKSGHAHVAGPWSSQGWAHTPLRDPDRLLTRAVWASGQRHSNRSNAPAGLTSSLLLFRGHKRKLNEADAASESSPGFSAEEEGSSSEADEMAAALEAELHGFM